MDARATYALRKVPEVTAVFWATKLLTTAMGEAFSDFLANAISPYLAVGLGFVAFAAALILQFRTKGYVSWVYWLAVAMVAVFGTMAADVLHKQFGVPYWLSTVFFMVVLGAVFAMWYRVEGTLSIHSITSPRREVFYWLTVVSTFALGTAAGDWTANSLGWGYLVSGVVFAGVILLPAIGRALKLNEVVTFWFAYIVTRPLGALFADWFGKPKPHGLAWGDGTVTLLLSALIVAAVVYMTYDRREKRAETTIAQ